MAGNIRNKKCLNCSRVFYNPYGVGLAQWNKRKYCSKKCSSSVTSKGRNAWNKGLKGYLSNEKHYLWKGESVSYRNLHRWVERCLGKASKCMNDSLHRSTRYHWANISKEYKRDLSDWIELCPSCNGKDRIGRRVAP